VGAVVIRIYGVPQTVARLAAVAARAAAAAPKASEAIAEEVANSARDRVPVLTGETQASIETTPEGVQAGAAAIYLEFGTSRMAAQPFLRPAADEATGAGATAIFRAAVGVL